MASATVGNVVLELTPGEAQTLLKVCNNVIGPSAHRQRMHDIGFALEQAGIGAAEVTVKQPLFFTEAN